MPLINRIGAAQPVTNEAARWTVGPISPMGEYVRITGGRPGIRDNYLTIEIVKDPDDEDSSAFVVVDPTEAAALDEALDEAIEYAKEQR